MKKSEILEYGKTCNFELDKEVKDLSGNTFFSLRNPTTDLKCCEPETGNRYRSACR